MPPIVVGRAIQGPVALADSLPMALRQWVSANWRPDGPKPLLDAVYMRYLET